jgi:hypothetical protein
MADYMENRKPKSVREIDSMPIPSGPNACDGSTPMHSGSKSPVAHSNRTQFTGRADTLRRPLTTARVENQVCCVFRDGGVKYTILYAQTMSPRVWSIRKPFTKMPVDSSKCKPRLIRLLLDCGGKNSAQCAGFIYHFEVETTCYPPRPAERVSAARLSECKVSQGAR